MHFFFLLLILLSGHGQLNYMPCYQHEFIVRNPTAVAATSEEITIELDTHALVVSAEKKLDPECRDLRVFTNETGKLEYLEFWFEDKCGTTNRTRIWVIMPLVSALGFAHIFVQYASDNFVEYRTTQKPYYNYTRYTSLNHNHPNNTNRWDGYFYKLSEGEDENKATEDEYFEEASGRMLLSRSGSHYVKFPNSGDDMFQYDDPNDGMLSSFHKHDYIKEMNFLGTEDYYKKDTGDGFHIKSGGSDTTVTFAHVHEKGDVPVDFEQDIKYPYLPRYTNYRFLKSPYNRYTKDMVILVDSDNKYTGFESVWNASKTPNYLATRGIRLTHNDTIGHQAGCEPHRIKNKDVYVNFTTIVAGPVGTRGLTYKAGGVPYPTSDHAHTFTVTQKTGFTTRCAGGQSGEPTRETARTSHRKTVILRAKNSNYNVRNISEGIHMANKLPPMGYKSFNWDWTQCIADSAIPTTVQNLPLFVYDNVGGDYTLTTQEIDFGYCKGRCCYAMHPHVHEFDVIKNVTNYGPGTTTIDDGPTYYEYGPLYPQHGHIASTNPIRTVIANLPGTTGQLPESWLFSSRWYGFMPHYFTRKPGNALTVELVGEVRLLADNVTCQRGSIGYVEPNPIIPIVEPGDGGDDDDFQWAFVYGPTTAILLLFCGTIPIVVIFVLCVVCCCAFFWVAVVVAILLVLCCLCCCAVCIVCALNSVLMSQIGGIKEMIIKEGAQQQVKIAHEKADFRKEKQKADEELKELEEQEKKTKEKLQNVEDEIKTISSRPTGIVVKSNIKVIKFEDVEQEKRLGKGYLGFKIFMGFWEGDAVLFRVFPAKTFKTKKFNVFGNFENELREYSTLEHPNVLRYMAYSKIPEVGVVTEYCENATLPIYFKRQSMTFDEKVKVISQIVEGMYYLHNRGVVHRDLQAGNIFLTEDLVPKVDFGFNRTFSKNYECSQYAAPELIEPQSIPDDDDELPNHEKFDVKCDVFSFGVLMFEIANAVEGNERNFNAYGVEDRSEQIALKAAEDSEFRPDFDGFDAQDVPNWFVNLAQMCWSHNATERPSFERVRNILKNVSSMEDGSDSPSSSGTETEDSD